MNLLVTGGAGFIGSNFTRYWVEQHPDDRVAVLDLLTYAGNRPNLEDVEDRITFIRGDIGDPDLGVGDLQPPGVVARPWLRDDWLFVGDSPNVPVAVLLYVRLVSAKG